ncbi:MAG TPA: hypothetical protein VFL45_06315 [Gammaproteobacteria bacterium]|nr:hypothetical protein [Gammaproteobacteria bacterium]
MFLRNRPWWVLASGAVFFIAGSLSACGVSSSAAIYRNPPPGVVQYGSGKVPVDPDDYAVNPGKYPVYRAKQDFDPPSPRDCWANFVGSKRGCSSLPQTKVLASDVWHVTHMIDDRYLIESDTYNNRECQALATKYAVGLERVFGSYSCQYNFAIYIRSDGTVSGGWELLPSSQKVLSARYTYLSYAPRKNEGWPSGQVFEKLPPEPEQKP